MFIEALLLSVIAGYIFKGSLKNLGNTKIHHSYLAIFAFIIEFMLIILIKKHIITKGAFTYILDLLMYSLLFIFVYLNRSNKAIIVIGLGFFLNAMVIFLNRGAMPVSKSAYEAAGLNADLNTEGLYSFINSDTRLWFLGDIIPKTFLRNFVVSIGDIVSAVGLFLFIIVEMKNKKITNKISI